MFVEINEIMTREQQLEDILQRLVDLKDHKEKYGRDEHYQSEQPLLWQIARERLASDGDLADVSDVRHVCGLQGFGLSLDDECPACRNMANGC